MGGTEEHGIIDTNLHKIRLSLSTNVSVVFSMPVSSCYRPIGNLFCVAEHRKTSTIFWLRLESWMLEDCQGLTSTLGVEAALYGARLARAYDVIT